MKRSCRLYREQLQKMSVGYSEKDTAKHSYRSAETEDKVELVGRMQIAKGYKGILNYQMGVGMKMNQPLEPLY